HAKCRLERGDDGDRCPTAHKDRWLAPFVGERLRGALNGPRLRIETDGCTPVRADELGCAIRGQMIANELMDGLEHAIGILTRHEAAGDFRRSFRRNDSLRAGALIATRNAIELERGARPQLLDDGAVFLP